MIRSLAMIAVAGFIVSIISLAGATALGGADLARHGWSFPVQWNWDDDEVDSDGRSALRRIDWNSPETTRDMGWAGDDELVIALPAEVTVTQADTPKITVTGPKDAVDNVVVDDGRIGFRGRGDARVTIKGMNIDVDTPKGFKRLKIEVSAPNLRSVHASVASRVNLVGLKGDELELQSTAASQLTGHVEARRLELRVHSGAKATLDGRADDLDVEVHSGADANLDRLVVKTARAEAHSGGDVEIAPTELADLEAHSGGDIVVHGRPPQVSTDTNSGGSVRYVDAAPTSPTPPAAPSSPAKPVIPGVAAPPSPPSAPTPPSPPATPRPKTT